MGSFLFRPRHPFQSSLSHSKARVRPSRLVLGLETLEDRCLFAAGALDSTFGSGGKVILPYTGSNAIFNAVAIQNDGKIVAAGLVDNGFQPSMAVARFNPNGSLDTGFGLSGGIVSGPAFAVANSVALLPDGRIVVAGYKQTTGSNKQFVVAGYSPDGAFDSAFGSNAGEVVPFGALDDQATSIAVQSDGQIIVGGFTATSSVTIGGHTSPNHYRFAVARLNSTGGLDASFDGDGMTTTLIGGEDQIQALTLQPDGKIVATGSGFELARYNTNGSLDTSFNGTGKVTTDFPGKTAWQSYAVANLNGKIVVAGRVNNSDLNPNIYAFGVARYNSDGSLDTSFNGSGEVITPVLGQLDTATSVVIQPGDKVVAGGFAYDPSGSNHYTFALARYRPNGTLDTGFDGDGLVTTSFGTALDKLDGLALQSDGQLVGVGTTVNGSANDFAAARYQGGDTPTTTGITNVTVAEDSPDTIVALRNDFNDTEDGSAGLTYTLQSVTGTAGLLSSSTIDNSTGNLDLAYASNLSGSANLTIRATDTDGRFVETTFKVTVTPVNDKPVAAPATITLPESGQASVTLTGTDVETSAANLTFTITSLPTKGLLLKSNGVAAQVGDTIVGSPGHLTYLLEFGAGNSSDSFQYTVKDTGDPAGTPGNALTSSPATITLNTPANSAGIVRIGGTLANDTIQVTHTSDNLKLQVTLNGVVLSNSVLLSAITQVRILARDGADSISYSDLPFSATVDGGIGSDTFTLSGSAGNDTVAVTTTGVTLNGASITNTAVERENLTTGAGNDSVVFSAGAALTGSIDGGTGTNTLDYSLYTTAVSVNLATGLATGAPGGATSFQNVTGGGGADHLTGTTSNNVLIGNGGNDTLTGDAGNDTYRFDTDNALGSDTVNEAGGGVDTLDFSPTTTKAVVVNLGVAGAQVVNSNLTLTLGSGSTVESVVGGTLNDTLTGNSLNNLLNGQAGNDTYLFDTDSALGSDTISESGVGTDTLNFASTTTKNVAVNLGVATAQVVNSNLTLTLGSASTIEYVLGGSLNDTLTGNNLNNILNGQAGSDTYIFDTDTALGSDTISESGVGTDTLNFASTTTKNVAINLGVATAQVVNSNLTLTLGSTSTIENVLGGSLDDKLTGNSLNNILNGQVGNDTYFFDTDSALGSDTISESGTGIDAVNFANTTTKNVAINLGVATAQVVNSNLTLTLGSTSTIENVVGGTLNDSLTGNSLNNAFSGLGGNDSYSFDTDSALGNDTISESGGIDTLSFAATTTKAVAVNLGIATAQVVNSNLTLTLGSASSMEYVIGGSLDDKLTGNSLNNILNGQAGNDTYFFDTDSALGSDTISESGVGTDAVNFANTTTKNVAVNLGVATAQVVNSNLTLTLGSASTIENVVGGTLNDSLTGNSLNNTFSGLGGNDTYFFDTDSALGNDTIAESGGTDTLNFSGTTTQSVAVNLGVATAQVVNSNLTLTLGSVSTIENVVGTSLNDTLTGNNLNNLLNGQAGNDTYAFDTDSAQGNDTISESTGTDTLTFAATTTKSVAVNLGIATAQVVNSNLTLTLGSASTMENVLGGSSDDILTGNSLNNVLNGQVGDDTYVFDTDSALGNDTIAESGVGTDTLNFSGTTTKAVSINLGLTTAQVVNSNLTLTLTSATTLENVLGGSLADTLTGNALNNVLSGGAGNDSLSGGDGRDILIGGAGADTLSGGNDEDLLLGALYSQANNLPALNALMSEWGRTDLAYQQRIDHLTGANTSGANNGSFLLTTTTASPTVTDDAATDTETGNAALDWFFRNSGDNVTDASGETITPIP